LPLTAYSVEKLRHAKIASEIWNAVPSMVDASISFIATSLRNSRSLYGQSNIEAFLGWLDLWWVARNHTKKS
jgi:hypothetical protein